MKLKITAVSLAAILASAPALAQDNAMQTNESVDILGNWSYGTLYEEGRSVNDIIQSADLFGPTGDKIGSVENIIFTDDGEARALVAEVGGFWDIGDTHLTVPWDEVTLGGTSSGIEVPVTEDSVDDYAGVYDDYLTTNEADGREVVDDDLETGPGIFKATDLVGDYAALSDRTPYGYVSDLLIDGDGDISAVIVEANAYGNPGYYAYPYSANAPTGQSGAFYGMPFNRNQIDSLEQFDYDQLSSAQS